MALVRTDLRNTRESAKRIRFEPGSGIIATNVQDAIEESAVAIPAIQPTNVGATPYLVQNTDTVLWVDTSVGPVTINMPVGSARNGRQLQVKDAAGQAAANPISLVVAGAGTVDGLDPYPIDVNYGGVTLYPTTGDDWHTQP